MKTTIEKEIAEHLKVAETMSCLTNKVEIAAQLCIDTLQEGGKLLIFGNGGSAADAQHIAAELVGRYKVNRKGLSALALTTDSSALTAISNDFGYKSLFNRQVEALANKGDVLIGISTSGKSINVINALKIGSQLQCKTIGFSGNDGGQMNKICDVNLVIPSKDTPRIQEMHIVLGHTICHLIDLEFKD
ncbi:D-sedoheptulose 7-phosphate isomerase [Candidatus Pseudothioglobus singularis]|nr:D-sedoheptulose 7-phosphate isomerase [Candidatus Pseudothioglobus singularis]